MVLNRLGIAKGQPRKPLVEKASGQVQPFGMRGIDFAAIRTTKTSTAVTKLDRLAIGVPYADKSNIERWGHTRGRDRRCRGNTWFIPYKTIHQRDKQRPHPATFPTELAAKCIRLHGQKGSVVVDPFLGIGHSAFAAKECGLLVSKFYGFDIDEEYLKVGCDVLGCGYRSVIQKSPSRLLQVDA